MANEKSIVNALTRDTAVGPTHEVYTWYATLNNSGVTASILGNHSATPALYFIQPPEGETWRVARLMVMIEDGTVAPDSYGADLTLTTGLQVILSGDTRATNVLSGILPIKTNAHWQRLTYDVNILQGFAAGNDVLGARWTFTRMGDFVRLVGDAHERLVIVANDDFTGLVDHDFCFQGYKE